MRSTNLTIKTILWDADGCIVDLSRTLARYDGYSCVLHWSEALKDTSDDFFKDSMKRHVINEVFTNALPMVDFEEMKTLMSNLKQKYEIKILTSASTMDEKEEIARQKLEWFDTHLGDIIDIETDVIIVYGSAAKLAYGSKDTVLIDDYPKTHKRFKESGFPIIYHKNAIDTRNQLLELLSQ